MKTMDILVEVIEISDKLSIAYNEEEGRELNKFLTVLNGYLARMPRLEAEAEYNLNQKKGEFSDMKGREYSATVFREKLQEVVSNEQKAYKFVERLNRNAQLIQKSIITQLSYNKAQKPVDVDPKFWDKMNKLENQVRILQEKVSQMEPPERL